MASGADELLREEAWRNERAINVFRAIIWTLICASILISGWLGGTFHKSVTIGLAYGIAAAVLGRTWLRKKYHVAVPYLTSALDVLVLALIADRTHLIMLEKLPAQAMQQLRDMLAALMLLLGVNVLRFSWRVTAWSTLCTVIAYLTLMGKHHAYDDPTAMMVNTGLLVGLGSILSFSAHKLRIVVHRVKERDAFARFLPEPVVEQLSRDPSALGLGGQQRVATVLFADIRGFTTMAEEMDPQEVVALLNEYFGEMVDEIFDNEGILDKFIGDGICAVFGPIRGDTPPPGLRGEEDHARRAVRCAEGMLRRLGTINKARSARKEPDLRIGIGIHTGRLVAGNIGSPRRLEYTHIGDTVNTAARVEGLTKELGHSIVVTESTRALLGDEPPLTMLGSQALRGRHSLTLYGVKPRPDREASAPPRTERRS